MNNGRILVAEAIGTTILMLGGPGVAVLAAGTGYLDGAAVLAVALGFGLALLVAAYTIGHVSGAHINPAVTVGMLAIGAINLNRALAYWIGQIIGAVFGAFLIWAIRAGAPDAWDTNPLNFATNLWDEGNGFFGFWPMVLTEIVLTAVLVLAVLSTTRRGYTGAALGIHVGLTLTLIHLISIPVDNTSVNPARSLGMAVFAGGDAIEQLWAFIVFPVLGAVLGVALWLAVDDADVALVPDASNDANALAGGPGPARSTGRHPLDAQPGPGTPEVDVLAVDVRPFGAGSHGPHDNDTMPVGYPIKGNVDSMLYHRPDSRNYGATVAEVWFDSPESAETAGFTMANTHPKD